MRNDGKVCGSIIKTSHHSPKGLKTHLTTVHSINPEHANPYFVNVKNQTITKFAARKSVKSKRTIGASLARMATKNPNMTLNALARDEELKFLFEKVYNKSMPSVWGIRKYILDYFGEVKVEITERIAELCKEQKWTLTFDEWTSVRMKQMLNVIVHFKGVSFNLGVIGVHKISCTSETLLEMIKKKLAEYNLKLDAKKVVATADGASVNIKLERISNISVQRCQNHGINLAILDTFYSKENNSSIDESDDTSDLSNDESSTNDESAATTENSGDEDDDENDINFMPQPALVIPKYKTTIQKASRISNTIRNSAMLKRILKKYTKLQPLKQAKTRWSSLAKMTKRFIEILPEIRKVYIDAKRPLRLSDDEAKILAHIPKLLCPVAKIVEKLSHANATLLTADVEMTKLINELNSIEFDEPTNIRDQFVQCLMQRYISRRTELSDILQYLLSSKYNPSDNIFYTGSPSKEAVKECFNMLCSSNVAQDPIVPQQKSQDPMLDTMDVDLTQFTAKKSKATIDYELDRFLETKELGDCLMELAKILLAVKPTSTDVERTFSICGIIVNKLRNKMKGDLLNALVVCKYY